VLVAGTVVTATGPHGGDERADRLSFDIGEVARAHALLAWLLLGVTVAALWLAYRATDDASIRRRGAWVVGAILVQGAIGYTQYFTGVPPWLVIVHVLGSTLVWIAVLEFFLSLKAHPVEAPARQTVS
jgi:heme a synthase